MKNAPKSGKEKAALVLGTVFGMGYVPKAPGTVASLVAALFFFSVQPDIYMLILLCTVSFILGIIVTPAVEKIYGNDPSQVVIDEVAGQWVAFLFVENVSWPVVLAGFILFRLFDILKPLGVNRLQDLPAGWGVMLDDIAAGLYSAIILYFLISRELII